MLLLIRIFNTFDTPRTKSNGVHILKAMKVSKKLIDFFNTTFSDDFMKTSLFGTVLKKKLVRVTNVLLFFQHYASNSVRLQSIQILI